MNPTLPLVKELVARGRHVTFYNADYLRDRIENTGADFRAHPVLEYDPQNVDPNPARLAATLMDAAERLLLTHRGSILRAHQWKEEALAFVPTHRLTATLARWNHPLPSTPE